MNSTVKNLIEAEKKAANLFNEIELRELLIPGKSEEEINIDIYNLAFEMFGIQLNF
jgi:Xaa-Pro dipeptidase